MGRVSN